MKGLKRFVVGTFLGLGLFTLLAPAAKAQVPTNNSSIVAPGNGSQSAGCLSPNDSCNTSVSGATLKSNGNQLNGNNPTATSAGGDSRADVQTNAGGAIVNTTNEAPKAIQLGLQIGGRASTPSTFGQGGGIELVCNGRSFIVEGNVRSSANNFLGIIANGRSKPGALPGTDEVINEAIECSTLEQTKAVNNSSLEVQFAYLLQVDQDTALAFIGAKLLLLPNFAVEEHKFSVLVHGAKTPELKAIAILYGMRVIASTAY